jgi:hypothetical protein
VKADLAGLVNFGLGCIPGGQERLVLFAQGGDLSNCPKGLAAIVLFYRFVDLSHVYVLVAVARTSNFRQIQLCLDLGCIAVDAIGLVNAYFLGVREFKKSRVLFGGHVSHTFVYGG